MNSFADSTLDALVHQAASNSWRDIGLDFLGYWGSIFSCRLDRSV